MGSYLSKQYFDSICQYLFNDSNEISAGLDRVTADNFIKHASDNYEIIKRKMSKCTYRFTNFKKIDTGKRIISIPTCRDKVVLEYLKCISSCYSSCGCKLLMCFYIYYEITGE